MSVENILIYLKEVAAIFGPTIVGIFLILKTHNKLKKSYEDTKGEEEKESRIIYLRACRDISIITIVGALLIIVIGILYLINIVK